MMKLEISTALAALSKKTITRLGNIQLGVLVGLSIGNMPFGGTNYPHQGFTARMHTCGLMDLEGGQPSLTSKARHVVRYAKSSCHYVKYDTSFFLICQQLLSFYCNLYECKNQDYLI